MMMAITSVSLRRSFLERDYVPTARLGATDGGKVSYAIQHAMATAVTSGNDRNTVFHFTRSRSPSWHAGRHQSYAMQ